VTGTSWAKHAKGRSVAKVSLLVALAVAAAGCTGGQGPQFRMNFEGRDPQKIRPAQIEAIGRTLEKLFGTPDEPRIPEGVALRAELLGMAAGPPAGDAQGRQQGLFRRYCSVCHGISGDGAGPAAALLGPYPRDFRDAIFKYTSTAGGARPTRGDLRRVLQRGMPGTAMPAYDQLPPEQIDALVEYVKYLSLRGQTELFVIQLVVDEDVYLPLDRDEVMEEGVVPAAAQWARAESLVVQPAARPPINTPDRLAASIDRARQLYGTKEAQCVKCHGPTGTGDGEETELYDDWNKRKKGLTPDQTAQRAPLFALPIQRLRARDFRAGVFRGGSRPEDLYVRIHVGIKGTPMPAAGPAPGSSGVLAPEQIWDMVRYVLSLAGKE